MHSKIIKFMIKGTKQVVLLLIIILLAVPVLHIFIKATSPATSHTDRLLKKNSARRQRSEHEVNLFPSHEKPRHVQLKDLFKISCKLPGNKKFNLPFVLMHKHKAMRQIRPAYNTADRIFPKTYGNLNQYTPDFAKDMRVRQGSNTSELSVLFASNKIAMVKIGEKEYYVHSRMNIKGNYIISISIYGLSYSRNGKIKHLSVN